jgi:hypothetical protein
MSAAEAAEAAEIYVRSLANEFGRPQTLKRCFAGHTWWETDGFEGDQRLCPECQGDTTRTHGHALRMINAYLDKLVAGWR